MRFFLFLFLFGFSNIAYAANKDFDPNAKIYRLNPENVAAFLQYTGNQSINPTQDFINFMQDHIAKDAVFTANLRYHYPKDPSKEENITLDKDQYLAALSQSFVKDQETSIDVSSVLIGDQGHSANAVIMTREKGTMQATDQNKELIELKIETITRCEQDMDLDKNHKITIQSAKCESDLQFLTH
jgi:hypothetical protein